MRAARPIPLLLAAVVALSACQAKVGLPTAGKPKGKVLASASAAPGPVVAGQATSPGFVTAAVSGPPRVVPADGPVVSLMGKAKLISDHGGGLLSDHGGGLIGNNAAGIISNNTGGLIANNGGGLIANNGGGLIANNGGGLIANNGGGIVGKTKYAVTQAGAASPAAGATPAAGAAPALGEFLLADAEIRFFDAKGQQLVDAKGQPIAARTDREGNYTVKATLPAENLVMRIRLWNGGELSAIVAKDGGGAQELAIDTAATLGATYVLSRFVKGDQKTFDKLPASEAARLLKELDALRGVVKAAPTYEPEALVQLADDLRAQVPQVDKTLKDIEILLLGGLGDGKQADRVALNRPSSVALAPDGSLYVAEEDFGRVRKVAPDGSLTTFMDGGAGVVKTNLIGLVDMISGPDGTLYFASERKRLVYRLKPGGTPEIIAGTGKEASGAAERPATEIDCVPEALALGPDGTLYVAEDQAARVLMITPDGVGHALPNAPIWTKQDHFEGLSVGPDGALYLLVDHEGDAGGGVWRYKGSWTELERGLTVGEGDMVVGPDGSRYEVEDEGKRVRRVAPDGTATVLAGEGAPEGAPAFVSPSSVLLAPDGTLYVGDRRRNAVWAMKPDGTWRVVAGSTSELQVGPGGDLTFNGPAGVAFDAQGRMLVAESTGQVVKRYDGTSLVTVAGSVKGDRGDGGPALEARFDTPGSILMRGDELLVLDARNGRIRAVGPDGLVRSLVGTKDADAQPPLQPGEARLNSAYRIHQGVGLAQGPDGALYWTSAANHQVARLRADGRIELVAGRPLAEDERPTDDGTDGPAVAAGLCGPTGLAFDKAGDLYVADSGNLRIVKITGLNGPEPKLTRFAGLGRGDGFAKLFDLKAGWEAAENGLAALDALMLVPAAICFDPAGNLYVGEGGTASLATLSTDGDGLAKAGIPVGLLPLVGPRVRKISPDGRIQTVMGPGGKLLPDPNASDALGLPTGIAIDPQGRLVVVDVRGNAIRIVPAGGF